MYLVQWADRVGWGLFPFVALTVQLFHPESMGHTALLPDAVFDLLFCLIKDPFAQQLLRAV